MVDNLQALHFNKFAYLIASLCFRGAALRRDREDEDGRGRRTIAAESNDRSRADNESHTLFSPALMDPSVTS